MVQNDHHYRFKGIEDCRVAESEVLCAALLLNEMPSSTISRRVGVEE